MPNRSTLSSISIACLLAGGVLASGQEEAQTPDEVRFEVLPADLVARAAAMRETALTQSRAYEFLAELTGEVGPRLAGSENDRRAVAWANHKLEALGFANVRAEPVVVPHWQRGAAAGQISAPAREPVELVALGGSVGTSPGGIEAEVVEVGGLEQLARLERSQVAGRIVFINRRMPRTRDGSGYSRTVPIRRDGPSAAATLGAAALLIRSVATSDNDVAHTGMTHYQQGVPRIPAAALSNAAADLLAARVQSGVTVQFRLELGCRDLPDSMSANVIAEIPGRESPQEVVLLAAHLDSWDLGSGALDDGAGCAIITEAARLIGELEPPPRRTVRVLLAANEETGVSGGLAYDDRYVGDMGLHVAAMEADFGSGRVWEMRSRVAERALPAARDLALLLAPLGIEYSRNGAFGGVDLIPLLRHQVPMFDLRQDATHYFDAYHSTNDTLDRVDSESLAQVVAAYAVTALVAAEHRHGFGRAPKLQLRLPAPLDRIAEGLGPVR